MELYQLIIAVIVVVLILIIILARIFKEERKHNDVEDNNISANTNSHEVYDYKDKTSDISLDGYVDNTNTTTTSHEKPSSNNKVDSAKVKIVDAKVVIMFILSTLFIILGFFKRFVYVEPERYSDIAINYYVGGDAYNFIINSNHMIAYFILALIFALIACALMIVNAIKYQSLSK